MYLLLFFNFFSFLNKIVFYDLLQYLFWISLFVYIQGKWTVMLQCWEKKNLVAFLKLHWISDFSPFKSVHLHAPNTLQKLQTHTACFRQNSLPANVNEILVCKDFFDWRPGHQLLCPEKGVFVWGGSWQLVTLLAVCPNLPKRVTLHFYYTSVKHLWASLWPLSV